MAAETDEYGRPVDFTKNTGPRAVAVFLKQPVPGQPDEPKVETAEEPEA